MSFKKSEWDKGFDAGYKSGLEDLAWAIHNLLDKSPQNIINCWANKVKRRR